MFVIDTISFKCHFPITEINDDWQLTHWSTRITPEICDDPITYRETFRAHHVIFGIFITGYSDTITSVKVSLPRLIHGDNARLIENQEQVDTAIDSLFHVLSDIANTTSGIEYYTRVDLCWQFHFPPDRLIRAHRNCRFPRCRRPNTRFRDRSASWDYEGKRFAMYDKTLERENRNGDISRIEIQLSNAPLRRYLANGRDQVAELDFNLCYRAYRDLMITFAPSVEVDAPRDIYEAIAILEEEAAENGTTSPMDLILQCLNTRTASDWRRKVTAAQLRREQFQWETVLPESGPPEAVCAM